MEEQRILEKIDMEKAYVLAYFYNKVCLGILEKGEIVFNQKVDYRLLTQIRIFNLEKEIKFVRNDDTKEFEVTTIEDNGDISNRIDEAMMLLGNKIVSQNEKFTTVTQLGGILDLPFQATEEEVKRGIRIVVRNYLEEDNNHQVVIAKSRLVGFTKTEGGEWIG